MSYDTSLEVVADIASVLSCFQLGDFKKMTGTELKKWHERAKKRVR